MAKKITITIALNGTDINPFHKYGLTQNPFPQLAIGDPSAELKLQSLGGEPIPHDHYKEYITTILQGFSQELIDLCVQNFRPGEYVKFDVFWEE